MHVVATDTKVEIPKELLLVDSGHARVFSLPQGKLKLSV